ncbi:unnamed protein product [Rangifer tarandus platyrhynchus]|uniref:Secreted protein n=1 Tax=Rangifer tarandus platyrhynchus TaxID=3082113 RepID=A0ABN8XIJ7_RANTA|nr:unnamed protein product [Rangifer tarandus platyrhynchus]
MLTSLRVPTHRRLCSVLALAAQGYKADAQNRTQGPLGIAELSPGATLQKQKRAKKTQCILSTSRISRASECRVFVKLCG